MSNNMLGNTRPVDTRPRTPIAAGLPSFPHSLTNFIRSVSPSPALGSAFDRGTDFKAAYLVVNGNFYFSEKGHMEIINRLGGIEFVEKHEPSHYGWFKIMPHPKDRKKSLFIIDTVSDYNRGRPAANRWDLRSLDEYFAFFYVVLLKSGIDKFSIRLTCGDKRAPGINRSNWQIDSQLLHPEEKTEAGFICQLANAIRS